MPQQEEQQRREESESLLFQARQQQHRTSTPPRRRSGSEKLKDGGFSGGGGDGAHLNYLQPPTRAPVRYPWKALMLLMPAQVMSSVAYSALNAVLALYFTTAPHLHLSDAQSTSLVGAFNMVIMIAGAILGGLLNDYWLGNFKTQVVSYCLWSVGAVGMLLATFPAVGDALGDTFVAVAAVFSVVIVQGIGYGTMNLIQNVIVADQFHGHPQHVVDSSFSIFYFFTNVGSMAGEFTGPVLRQYTSWQVTTSMLLLSTVLGGAAFIAGGPLYRKVLPRAKRHEERVRARVLGVSMGRLLWQDTWRDAKTVGPLLLMFTPLPVFWALFYQQNSTWVFQAQRMERYLFTWGDTRVVIPPDLMPSLEDVVVLVMIFFFDKLLYPGIERCGSPVTPLRKIAAGILCVSASFALSGAVEVALHTGARLSVAWQVPQIFLMGCGEVLVAIAGIDFAYTQAPERTRGVMNGAWGLSQAAGQILVIAVFSVFPANAKTMVYVFFGFAVACALTCVVFALLARRYRYVDPQQLEEDGFIGVDGSDGGGFGGGGGVGSFTRTYDAWEDPNTVYPPASHGRAPMDIGINVDSLGRPEDERDRFDSGKFSLSTSEHGHLYEPPHITRMRKQRESQNSLGEADEHSDGDDRDDPVAATPPRARNRTQVAPDPQ